MKETLYQRTGFSGMETLSCHLLISPFNLFLLEVEYFVLNWAFNIKVLRRMNTPHELAVYRELSLSDASHRYKKLPRQLQSSNWILLRRKIRIYIHSYTLLLRSPPPYPTLSICSILRSPEHIALDRAIASTETLPCREPFVSARGGIFLKGAARLKRLPSSAKLRLVQRAIF